MEPTTIFLIFISAIWVCIICTIVFVIRQSNILKLMIKEKRRADKTSEVLDVLKERAEKAKTIIELKSVYDELKNINIRESEFNIEGQLKINVFIITTILKSKLDILIYLEQQEKKG